MWPLFHMAMMCFDGMPNKRHWTGKMKVAPALLAVACCFSQSLFWVANISTVDLYQKSCCSVRIVLSWRDIIWPWWKCHVIFTRVAPVSCHWQNSEPDFTFDSTDITARGPDDVIHCLFSILRVLHATPPTLTLPTSADYCSQEGMWLNEVIN